MFKDLPCYLYIMIHRLYLTLKHFPEKRIQQHKIPGTDPPQFRSYDDLRTALEEAKKDKESMRVFEMYLRFFHLVGINCDREEILDIFCKFVCNYFTIDNGRFRRLGPSIFVLETVFEHSCNPNADLVFNGTTLEVRAIKMISPGEKVTINRVDLIYLGIIRQRMLQTYFITCSCSKCLGDNEEGKFFQIFLIFF